MDAKYASGSQIANLFIEVFKLLNLAVRWPATLLVTRYHKSLNDYEEHQEDSQATVVRLEKEK